MSPVMWLPVVASQRLMPESSRAGTPAKFRSTQARARRDVIAEPDGTTACRRP